MERTLILIKPDAIQRGLAGSVLNRFERKGLKIAGIKMMQLTDDLLKEHDSHIADTYSEKCQRKPQGDERYHEADVFGPISHFFCFYLSRIHSESAAA